MIVSIGDSALKQAMRRATKLCCCGLISVVYLTAISTAGDAATEHTTGSAEDVTGPHWSVSQGESDWQFIVIHHSATQSGSVPSIHRDHRSRKDVYGNHWLGIGYHFVIGNGNGQEDGKVEATFRWGQQIHGAHAGNALYNARGIGICLIGNFEESQPTERQLAALQRLVRTLSQRHNISREQIVGHRGIKATACPGRLLPLDKIREAAEPQ